MRTSGKASERGLILIPLFVAAFAALLAFGPELPKTLYGIDKFIRDTLVSILSTIRSWF